MLGNFEKKATPKTTAPQPANDPKLTLEQLMSLVIKLETDLPPTDKILGQSTDDRDQLLSSFNRNRANKTAAYAASAGAVFTDEIVQLVNEHVVNLGLAGKAYAASWQLYAFWVLAGASAFWGWNNVSNEITIQQLRNKLDRTSVHKLLDIAEKAIVSRPQIESRWKKAVPAQSGPFAARQGRTQTQKDDMQQEMLSLIKDIRAALDKTSSGKRMRNIALHAGLGALAITGAYVSLSVIMPVLAPTILPVVTQSIASLVAAYSGEVVLGSGIAAVLGGLVANDVLQKREFKQNVHLGNLAQALRDNAEDYLDELGDMVNETHIASPREP
jgi:hypothetical protein